MLMKIDWSMQKLLTSRNSAHKQIAAKRKFLITRSEYVYIQKEISLTSAAVCQEKSLPSKTILEQWYKDQAF